MQILFNIFPRISLHCELVVTMSFSVAFILYRLGYRGKTVIMSIHQPRYSIFKTFDTISLLSDGEFVYQGPANQAMKYFEDIGDYYSS